ncbi:MAG TPA: cohesin domain-containing protein [Gemmataceae bacterium]|nr:cohesin domain-containing protein [Gemmataceae bacterium]
MFFSTLRQLAGRLSQPRKGRRALRKPRGTFRPQLEQLEDLTLLAINVTDVAVVEGNPTDVSGTLNPGAETDIFRFNGTAGQRLFFDNISASAGAATWTLLGPGNQSVLGSSPSLTTDFTVTLPADGTYILMLQGNHTAPINYVFRLTDVTDFAVPVGGLGTVQSGNIAAGQQVPFTFTAPAGQLVYFDTQDIDGDAIVVDLRDPTNALVAPFNALNASTEAGPVVLPLSGTYTLTVRGQTGSSTGDYRFRLLALPANATALTLGATVTGTLPAPFQTEVYQFTGTVGQRLYYDALDNDFDAVNVRLVSPTSGTVLTSQNSDSDSGILTLTESGTHYLIVESTLLTGTPDFSFRLLDVAAQATAALDTRIPSSGTLALSPGLRSDLYRISGTAGQRLFFDSLSVDVPFGAGWSLFGPGNQLVAGATFLQNDFEATLPGDGTYVLALQGLNPSAPVNYSFRIVTPDITTAALTLGSTVNGTISEPGEIDIYTFTGTPGQRLYFDSLLGAVSASTELVSPGGATVASFGPGMDTGPVTLTEAGTYRLVIDGFGDSTGSYSFRLLDVAVQPTATLDTTLNGTLDPGVEADLYRIGGTAGQRLFFDNLTTVSGSGTWQLFGPANQFIAGGALGLQSDFEATLPTDGTYVLALQGLNPSAPVNYSFRIVTPDTTTVALTLGNTISATISEPGEIDVYTFTGAIGQRLYFDSLGAVVNAAVSLVSPNSFTVFSGDPNRDGDPVTLPEAGTYKLIIDGTGDATGSYGFRLLDVAAQPTVALDTLVNGMLNPGMESALYRLTGTADLRLFFDSLSVSPTPSGTILWSLFGPDNQIVARSGVNLGNDFLTTLPTAGTYVLAVAPFSANPSVINYSFRIVTPDTTVMPLTLGVEVTAALSEPGEVDVYTFTGSVGQRLYFDQTGPFPGNGAADLTSPSGRTVFGVNISADSLEPVTLREAGTYRLTFQAIGDPTGSYRFRLLDVAAQPTLPLGTTVNGTLDPGWQTHLYTFTGTAGQRLLFDSLLDPMSPGSNWVLFGPANQVVGSAASLAADFTAVLPLGGTYVLAVRGSGNSPVSYRFQVLDQSEPPVTPSGFDVIRSGNLAAGVQTQFTYAASAGQVIYFDTQDIDFDSVQVELRDPGNTQVFVLNASSEGFPLPLTLTRSGTYTLTVRNLDTTAAGDYRFRLLALPANTTDLPLATVVNGTLPNFETDIFRFTGAIGQRIYLDSFDTDFENVSIWLYQPSNRLITVDNASNDGFPLTLEEAGTHYLIVDGRQAGTPNYSFRLLDVSAQPTVALDTTVNGTLNPGVESDLYRFIGTAGQRLFFDNLSVSVPFGGYWRLSGPSDDFINLEFFFLQNDFEVTLPADGPYVLVLGGTNTSGPVNYSFRIVTPDTTTAALTLGSTVNGTISEPGEIDIYTFTGTPGQRLFFDGLATAVNGTATLIAPSGLTVFTTAAASDSDPVTLTESGTYRLVIDGTGDSTGGYSFRLLDVAVQPTATLDTTLNGTLDPGVEADLYRIGGTAGQRLFFDNLTTVSGSGTWQLFGPANQFVASNSLGFDFEATLPTDGTYVLALQGLNPSAPVNYSFRIVTPDTTTVALTLGSTVNGTISEPGEIDVYTFTSTIGQRLFFDTLGAAETAFFAVTLQSPSGATVITTAPASDLGPFTLPEAGTYRLVFDYPGENTGSYSFRLLDVAAPPVATVTLDTTVTDAVNPGLEADLYRFSGTAGQRLFFDSLLVPSGSGTWQLFGPANQFVASNTLGFDFEATLPADGTYVLALQGLNPSAPVNYSFRIVTPDTTTTPLTLGNTISATISEPGEIDIYTFTGTIGQRLFFDSLPTAPMVNGTATLVSPSGVTLFTIGAGSDAGPITLVETGTYRLVIDGADDSTGPYSFRLFDLAVQPALTAERTFAVFTVSLSAASTQTVMVQFATSNVEAQARVDYQPASGTLTFAPGTTTRTIAVPVIRDTAPEPDEAFLLTLSNPVNDTLGDGQATGTITDDDGLTTLVVSSFTPTSTGFRATFSRVLQTAGLNLYDTETGGLGPTDVTLTGPAGTVLGSLAIDLGDRRITFIQTGGVLAPGTYMVTLRSGATGFRSLNGGLLDGNSDNTPGDNYTTTFMVPAPAAVTVSVPDFTRGPGQSVDVPATSTANDLPLRLSGSAGVTALRLTLRYDPALLSITAAAAVPTGATTTLTPLAPDLVQIDFNTGTALPADAGDFVRLVAVVPADAPYGRKHVLDLTVTQVTGVASALDDDGIHVVGYLGDSNANGRYSAGDAQRLQRVAVGLDQGFLAFPLADPRLVGDITDNAAVTTFDAVRVLQEIVGLDRPEIPPLPANPPAVIPTGADPLLSIPKTLRARRGRVVVVPVNLDVSDGLESADLAISYDTRRLEVVEVRRGSLTHDFDLFATNVDPAAGTIRAGLGRAAGPVSGRGSGSVLLIAFRIKARAPAGQAAINLRAGLGPTVTQLNDGTLDLNPDPSDQAGDALDGAILVRKGRRAAQDGRMVSAAAIDEVFRRFGGDVVSALDSSGIRSRRLRRA